MRRTVKNQKVMKIVALGIAAMLAFSAMPMTAFAEDGNQFAETILNDNDDTTPTVVEISEDAHEEAAASEELIEAAIEEVADVEPQTAEESIAADLADAQDFVTAADENLTVDTDEAGKTAAEELEIALDKAGEADAVVAAAEKVDPDAGENMVGSAVNQVLTAELLLDDAKNSITENADNAEQEAAVANTSDDKDEAYAAAEKAVEDVEKAEADLQAAADEYNKADEALQNVQSELDKANQLYEDARTALGNAANALGSAEENAKKAVEKMTAAQAKIDALEKQANDLTELKEQYYDMMVWYFRNCSGGAAVYKNGVLDVEASAKKITQTKIDENAKSIKTDLIPLTRYVTNLLVDYMLTSEGATDITFGQDGEANGYMQAGVLVKDNKNNDRVLLNNDNGAAEKTDIHWNRPGNTEDGRSNYVTVTYKDKNGDDQEIRVNYVLKSSKYDAQAGIADGIFYLAEIRNENGEVIVDRIVNENNFDDYQKLCKAYEALSDLSEYEEAARAVAAAADEVAALKAEIDRLQNITIDSSRLEALQGQLSAAQSALEAARIVKEGLEDRVEEARKIVDSIDLSRFAVVVVPADEAADFEESSADDNGDVVVAGSSAQTEDGDAQTADGNVTLVAAGGAAVQGQQVLGVNRTAAQDSSKKAAVLGVKREAGSEEIADSAEEIDETLLAQAEEITNETAETELVTIAEEEVALAKTFEQSGAQMNWWWLLLLLIVIALIVKKAYDDHRKKIEA